MRAGIFLFIVLGLLSCSVDASSFTNRMGRQIFTRLTDFLHRSHHTRQNLCRASGEEGICLAADDCKGSDGKYVGYCGNSNKVCCIVRKTCGDESSESLTYFENPKFPRKENDTRTCNFDLKIAQDTCAVRLDMDTVEMAPYSDGACIVDTLTVLGSEEVATPICGLMTNWTTTIKVKGLSEVKLAMVLQGDSYRFSIKLIQIPCKKIVRFHSPSYSGIINEDAKVYVKPTTTTTTPEPTTVDDILEDATKAGPEEEEVITEEPVGEVVEDQTEEPIGKEGQETTTTERQEPKPTTLQPGKIVTPTVREVVIEAIENPDDLVIEGTVDPVPSISAYKKVWEQKVNDRCWEYEEDTQPTQRVIGGSESNLNEYPWQVALVYGRKFFCGGSLISDRYVLTAAHCVFGSFGRGVHNVMVSIGDHDLSYKNETANKVFRVKRIHWHLNYSPASTTNDIALLELEKPVNFTYSISAVRLPSDLDDMYDNANATVTGWGRYDVKKKASSALMKEYTGPIVGIARCVKLWNKFPGINAKSPNNICLDVTMGTPCHGDSGGPLVTCVGSQCTQIGVVSFGFPLCTNVGLPAVFTRVSHYKKWIDASLTPLSYVDIY